MEPTITSKSVKDFVETISTVGGYDLVSDFGQEEIKRKEKEWAEKSVKGTVYFDESEESIVHRF